MIIEFNTGKTDIVLVKVPESTHSHKLTFHKGITRGKPYGYWHIDYEFEESQSYTHGGFFLFYKDLGGKKNYPKEGCLTLVGNPFELSEQECDKLVKSVSEMEYPDYGSPFEIIYYPDGETAKEAMNEILNNLKVYRVNPYSEERPKDCFYPEDRDGKREKIHDGFQLKWDEYQLTVGNWVLLTAVKA